MNLIEKLQKRYATKKFSNQKISEENLSIILESLTLTASSMGLQPWKFLVVENPELRAKLHKHSNNQNQVIDASHLIVLCRLADMTIEHIEKYATSIAKTRGMERSQLDGYVRSAMGFVQKLSTAEKDVWLEKQLYIALGNLLTSCAVLDIDACPMEGFVASEFDRELGLSKLGLKTVLVCPIGYRDDSDKYAHLPKVRFGVDEIVIRK